MDYYFTDWISDNYSDTDIKLDSWTSLGMQRAFEAGENKMKEKILTLVATARDRSPEVQKLYQEIQDIK